MLTLNLPHFTPKLAEKNGKCLILDPVRQKFIALTPEEWVRQHFVHFLITHKHYPQELLANEVLIRLNGTTKRCDTIVYNTYLEPLLVAEYKAPYIPITHVVFDQIAHYNMVLQVNYLIVSNGIDHYCCEINYEQQTYRFLEEIPEYDKLL